MTYEEAHKIIEDRQREMTKNRFLYTEAEISANGRAIEALEKQIPKKAVVAYNEMSDMYLVCPDCAKPIINVWSDAAYMPKYCHYCGQALDWGEQ